MGRIVRSVELSSFEELDKKLRIDALVDTGATYLTLPMAWKDRIGELEKLEESTATIADGSQTRCEICGPVRIQIEGFSAIYSSVMFIDAKPDSSGGYEPLLGYIPLEQSRAIVDMHGHRLYKAESFDLKGFQLTQSEKSILELRTAQVKGIYK